jgi:hypothetical protein
MPDVSRTSRPGSLIVSWVVVIAVLIAVTMARPSEFSTDIQFTSNPESQQDNDFLLAARGAESLAEQVVVSHPTLTVDDP